MTLFESVKLETFGGESVETPLLYPGDEYCAALPAVDGKTHIDYSYRSEHGQLFSCRATSVEDAHRQCEHWLLTQDRH